ncbi:glycosyltransferase family 2 protein [Acidovorax sp. FG27]|uniref:glycosyltransferase family 2 protein n=1 Tax=Acidovorax sp. FG27 TaxID=3133652 RepID=UPI00333ED1CA
MSGRQRAAFLAIQLPSLGMLLWLSATLADMFFSQFVAPMAVRAIVVTGGALAIAWQIAAMYRVLSMKRAVPPDAAPPTGLRIAMATTIVPSREFDLLRGKLEAMARVDRCGNAVDHWVLDEENDARVRAMVAEFDARLRGAGVRLRYFTRAGIARYNEAPSGRRFQRFQARQKGGNINAWLDATRPEAYDVVTFLDLDHMPKPTFYRTVLPYLRDPGVAFVQGPESFHNREQNFVTRAAAHERDTFVGVLQRSYFGLGMPVIVGSHTTFRAEALRDLGGFYPVHLTEDYLMMLRMRALGKRGIFVDEVIAVGELPSSWAAYMQQQLRWASGGLDLLVRYFPTLWRGFTAKQRLFTFTLLNYYAWGSFFMLAKGLLLVLLLCGVTLPIGLPLMAAIGAFILSATVANHLWERQFFVERARRSHLCESAVMNNFLGGLYGLSLVKALAAPNTAFMVTAKTGAGRLPGSRLRAYPFAAAAMLALEAGALAIVWTCLRPAGALQPGQYDVLAAPLVISALGMAAALAVFWHHERISRAVPRAALVSGD